MRGRVGSSPRESQGLDDIEAISGSTRVLVKIYSEDAGGLGHEIISVLCFEAKCLPNSEVQPPYAPSL